MRLPPDRRRTRLEHALDHALKDHVNVIPLIKNTKRPALKNWPVLATKDEKTLLAWWTRDDFNIGIVGGSTKIIDGVVHYLLIVDYDMKPGQRGHEALLDHEKRGLANTRTIKTPNGVHKIWWSKTLFPNSQGKLAPNVDVRCRHGYVVASGSTIEDNDYVTTVSCEIAVFPDELAALLTSGNTGNGAAATHDKRPIGELDQPHSIALVRDYLQHHAPEALQGRHGDQTTYQVAARCKDMGVSEEQCFDMMLDYWNADKASPPWAYDALRTKVSNAYRYGQNAPGSVDPRNEFELIDGPILDQKKDSSTIPLSSAFPINVTAIPPRDWIVPGFLLKNNVTLLVAPPGSGKSLLTLQVAIMVATGMDWGGWHTRKRCKVLVINSEDDMDEMRRRLYATAQQMGVDQAALAGRVFLAEAPESIVIARLKPGSKTVVRTPLVDKLIKTINDNDICCVVVDPFAETFEGDENSNSEVKWAGVLWREVARKTNSALVLVHHSRKYANDMAGEADVTRGGGSLIGIARVLCTLFTMTETEATAMGVPIEARTDHVRFDDAKANHSRRGAVRWFKKISVTLENAKDGIPGDEVGALVPWKPDLMEGITEVVLGDLKDTIDAGVLNEFGKPSGSYFMAKSVGRNNERWVGHAIMLALGCDESRAKAILKDWTARGWIESFDYTDQSQRKTRSGVRCSAANWGKIVREEGKA